jgi:hypothetical protein
VTVDVVPNFASFVERSLSDANAHGSIPTCPTLTTKRKRLHEEKGAKSKSSVKAVLQGNPEALGGHEESSHAHESTTKKSYYVNRRTATMN